MASALAQFESKHSFLYIWFKYVSIYLQVEVNHLSQHGFQCIWEVSWLPVTKGICCLFSNYLILS